MALYGHITSAATKPTFDSVDAARLVMGRELTVDEYALGRVIASEHFSGSTPELLCIGDACCNRAADAKQTLFAHITRGQGYGAQGSGSPARLVSSARLPAPRHILAAIALVRNPAVPFLPPPARGISKGARRFFDPKAQLALNKQHGSSKYCPPLALLERWTYNLAIVSRNGNGCQLGTKRGDSQEEWCGPITGVDPWVLMMFRPRTSAQDALYREARRVIESGGKYKGGSGSSTTTLVAVAAVVALGARFLGVA